MKKYKFSTNGIENIKSFLKQEFNFDWNGSSTPQMLNTTDCFVFLGQLANEINEETGEVISWLEGFHFDILTSKDLTISEGINQHNTTNPKHQFA